MNTEFKAKFLQHLANKKEDKGFTLIELLVVIIIIGILAAIALPSFLNQANKAKESESKQYIGSMNRTQQAHFLEKNSFSSDISLLGLGIKTDTVNYKYSIGETGDTLRSQVTNYSTPENPTTLRSHAGGVQVGQTAAGTAGEATTLAVLCQQKKPNQGKAGVGSVVFAPTTDSKGPTCETANFEDMGGENK
jgi:prepilin-type N-terminal cleavage/methylation domain-containing protein